MTRSRILVAVVIAVALVGSAYIMRDNPNGIWLQTIFALVAVFWLFFLRRKYV